MNLFKRFTSEDSPARVARAMLSEPVHPALHPEVRRALRWIVRHPESQAASGLAAWAADESLIHCLEAASRSCSFADWIAADQDGGRVMVYGTYRLADGGWQTSAAFEAIEEAITTLAFHAQGRGWVITDRAELLPPRLAPEKHSPDALEEMKQFRGRETRVARGRQRLVNDKPLPE